MWESRNPLLKKEAKQKNPIKMKKVFLALSVVALFALSSCNKEIECECDTISNGNVVDTNTFTIEEDDCSSLEKDMGTSKIECKEI